MLPADTMHVVGWLSRLLLFAVILPTGLLFGFLVFAGTDIVVSANGVVVPRARVQPVSAAMGGTLKEWLVEPGDAVSEGQVLAVLTQGKYNEHIVRLRAPANATVEEVSAHEPGDYVAGDAVMVQLLRSGGDLEVIAGIHPEDLDLLIFRRIREVVVRDAAVGQISATARLRSIGSDVARSAEIPGSGPAWPSSIYAARLELEAAEPGPQGRGRALQEGSKVEVEFNLGWENFLQRFLSAAVTSVRRVPCFER